jgi:hypothetical protein
MHGPKVLNRLTLRLEGWWARDENLRKDKYVDKSNAEWHRAIQVELRTDPRVSSFANETNIIGAIVTLRVRSIPTSRRPGPMMSLPE